MNSEREVLLLAGVAVVVFVVVKKMLDAAGGSASQSVNRYFSGVVRNPDGSVNVGATVGAINPSGIPAATTDQANAARLAGRFGVDIVYSYGLFDGTATIDAAGTVRNICWSLNIDPVYTWYGAVDVPATVTLLDQS